MSAAVELAQALVRIDTVNPPGGEAAAASVVGERLDAAGLDVQAQQLDDGCTSLVARLAGSGARPAICFTGHLDVVPPGSRWTRDPFAGEIDGDRLYGRGSSDMKGGVAAIVAAVEELARTWGGRAAGLEIVLTSGEETGCEGAKALVGSGLLGEVGAIVVAEPTANYPCIAHKGVLWLRAKTTGVRAHGATPELGRNAIYPLADAVARLNDFDFEVPGHPLLGEPTLIVGSFHGGDSVNSIPDAAVAEIDIRTTPAVDEGELLETLRAYVGPDVELAPILSLPAVETAPDDPWVLDVFDALEPLLGERPSPTGIRPFTDAAVLTPAYGGPPTIVCGPGEGDQAHRADEWCSINRIDQAVEVYVEIARRWCSH